MFEAKLAELAALVGGTLVGDGETVIRGAEPLYDAHPGDITLFDSADRNQQAAKCTASAAVAPLGVVPAGLPTIQVADVHKAFATIVACFRPKLVQRRIGISPQAFISPTAVIGDDVDVHPFATIGDGASVGRGSTIHSGVHIMAGAKVGEEVTIFPGAVLYENTVVGSRTILHAGVVLGAYGFGYTFADGRHKLTPQLGHVEIGADCEIGAKTTIDRGTYGRTLIGEGTKIDDQVMIGHNCHIGRHNMLCSQVGIAGSTSTGDYVVMAGQVGVRDHVHIGTRAVLGAMAGVVNDVPEGSRVIGIPATPERDQKMKQAVFSKLPEMRQDLKKLQATVGKLVERLDAEKAAEPPREEQADGKQAAA